MFGNHINNKLSAYCHDELPAPEARRVAEHLLHCRRCRDEYEEIKFGSQLAAQLREGGSEIKAPASLWSGIEMMLDREMATSAHRRGEMGAARRSKKPLFSSLSFKFAALSAALLILIGVYAVRQLRNGRPETGQESGERPSWAVSRIDGQPKIGERQIGAAGKLSIGEWLVTDDSSRAQISVGEIGEVQLEPNSRIRLVEARADEHRLALAHGKMRAFIWAPPKQFYVDTPSAVAVDLGCSYTLAVNDEGQGLLHVTSGWVAFEWKGLESFVPADAECVTRAGRGPGTPYFRDASLAFKNSLEQFDTANPGEAARAETLDALLAQARKRDALTLWHLLTRANEVERGRIFDRLSQLIPPPSGVTRESVARGDRGTLDAWWDKLELGNTDWWRLWKGPLPSQTK
jgi:hypothetical protein